MPKINKSLLLLSISFFSLKSFALNINIPQDIANNTSISVYDISNQKPVFDYKANTPRLIASNMKLVTTYVGLQRLGADFRWQTMVGYTGTIESGILNGDLIIIGGGDPNLSADELAAAIATLKINKVNGNVIYSNQYFRDQTKNSELYPEPFAEYSAEPSGLLINQGLTRVSINLNNANKVTFANPQVLDYTINSNRLNVDTKVNAACPYPDTFITISANQKTLYPSGTIPYSCTGKDMTVYIPNNKLYDNNAIAKILSQSGIQYNSIIANQLPESTITFASTKYSESLGAIIYTMNQQSNNLYAKTIFMTRNNESTLTTYTQSKMSYLDTLNKEFKFSELNQHSLENGSGLSRHEKLTTDHMIQLLNNLYNSPNKDLVLQSLPTPGNNQSTLSREFMNYSNMLFVKTGTLSDVKAYSGYFINQKGNVYSVSFVINGLNDSKTKQQQLNDFKQTIQNILDQLNKSN